MIRNLLLAICMIFTSNLFAQTMNNDRIINRINREIDDRDFREGTNEVKTYKDVQGSPYFTDDFVTGVVSGKDMEDISGKYRYNIYTDKIEYPVDEKVFSLEQPWKYNLFKIGDTRFFFQQYLDGVKVKKGFLIVLAEGKYNLFLKKKIAYMPEEPAQPYQTQKPNRFESGEDSYFLAIGNEPAKLLTTVKNLKKTFPELTQIIDSYKESTNLKKKNNIVNLINYINLQVSK